ncbi:hypothetical protein pipiens_018974, partial [Culex pipiens pipiens]
MSAVLHQLTRTEVGEDTCSNLRCLIADEIVHLEPAVLTSLGIPSDNESLQTFIFRLKTGHQNGGVASLVLLSSLLGVTIYLYRYNQDTLRMDPADQTGSVAVHIYEHIADESSTFSSVLRIVPDQPRQPQVPETTSDGKNPIIIADKISRTEFAGTPQSVHSSMSIPSHQGLRLGSLNVNGCRVSAKRDEIDALLVSHKVHVAVLQEVNLPCGEALSDHYHWHMGEPARNKRRGLAILVHRDYPIAIWHKKNQDSNIQYAQLVYQTDDASCYLDLVNVHGPNQNNAPFFSSLGTLISTLPNFQQLIILGDFNSQLANVGLDEAEQQLIVKNRSTPRTIPQKRPPQQRVDVDPSLLRHEPIRKKFKDHLSAIDPASSINESVEQSWTRIKEGLTSAANTTLKRRVIMNRECRLALAHLKKCQFWAHRSYQPKWKHRLEEAKENLRRKIRESEEKDTLDILNDTKTYRVGYRLIKAHKFFKRFKRMQPTKKPSTVSPAIKLDDWFQEDSGPDLLPVLQPESACPPLPDPPTIDEVRAILERIKNGKTPGVDNLYAEYLKYGGERVLHDLHELLKKVWVENHMPADWKQVVVVPIPKVKKPTQTGHYRKICLSSSAYKVYAIWILDKLQHLVGPIGNHQAAFLPGRSTTDHLFVLQRLLQERWNGGETTVLMSLDIEKAFDSVCLLTLPAILRQKGVPNNVINRVIECLRGEIQQVLWQRQLTRPMERRRGIKQGCPLSPFLFNLIMEAVLETVADEVVNLRLNPEGSLNLPFLLAFADDLIIIADQVSDVETILTSLKEHLAYVGLKLNESKCKVLVREPKGEAVPEVEILGKVYKTTEPIKYLGVQLTARLDRPLTVRTRCRNALRASRVVMDFLRKYRPPWYLGRAFYESLIAPSMIYGTQTAVLTKYSRRSIRGYERQIVHSLHKQCRDHSSTSVPPSLNFLLRKRRITKKIRMFQMRWWGHVYRRPRSHILRVAARLRPARLRACRPGFTWRHCILQTMNRYGNDVYNDWRVLAEDKVNFHKKLLEIFDKA